MLLNSSFSVSLSFMTALFSFSLKELRCFHFSFLNPLKITLMGWARFDLWSLCHSCQCVAHTGAVSQPARGQQPSVVQLWERGLFRKTAFRVWTGMAPIVQWTFGPQLMALFWKVIETFQYKKDKELWVYLGFPVWNSVSSMSTECYNHPQKPPFCASISWQTIPTAEWHCA
jgi:hypothetical protein